jgi:hypothetical protein
MSDPFGSTVGSFFGLTVRLGAIVACVALAAVSPVLAQEPLPDPPPAPAFMSRFDFSLSGAKISSDDNRFWMDTHWGGDFDLVDYGRGRATFLVDYQAFLGNEFRPFDPYQSNYRLEAGGSARIGRTEVYGVLNHVSRHLGDRPKRFAIAENSLGPRVLRRFSLGSTTLDTRVELRKVIQRSYMDYEAIGQLDLTLRHPLNSKVSLYGRGFGEMYWVDREIANRGRQDGGRVEAGVRLHGGLRGAVDLFAGYERVVDADPIDRTAQEWGFVGFRLVGN